MTGIASLIVRIVLLLLFLLQWLPGGIRLVRGSLADGIRVPLSAFSLQVFNATMGCCSLWHKMSLLDHITWVRCCAMTAQDIARKERGRYVGSLPKDPLIYQSNRFRELGRLNAYKRHALKYDPLITDPIDRFWSRVDKGPKLSCWEWKGGRDNYGYGMYCFGKVNRHAHAVAWELTFGKIPKGICVCHHCDNRSCCNPHHCFLGTNKENSEDMANKGRSAHGERHAMHKLTLDQVKEIRNLYANGGITHKQIARQFGIDRTNVGLIVRHKTWTRV